MPLNYLVPQLTSTLRNIYYKDPDLFKTQHVVDKYVDILAYTFGIQRAALNVVSRRAPPLQEFAGTCRIADRTRPTQTAAAKGLVIGDYTLHYADGSTLHQDSVTVLLPKEHLLTRPTVHNLRHVSSTIRVV